MLLWTARWRCQRGWLKLDVFKISQDLLIRLHQSKEAFIEVLVKVLSRHVEVASFAQHFNVGALL
jgi:hypothetical protein